MDTVATEPKVESWKTGSQEKRDNMAEYVAWLLTPESDREPKTKTAFAEQLGVTLQTLRNYNREPFVQRELAEKARAVARVDKLPDVIQALYLQASDIENSRSVQAAKVLLDWMQRTEEAREAPIEVEGMTDEMLVKTALEMLARANEKGE